MTRPGTSVGLSPWGQIQGTGGPSAGLSGLPEQGLDGNSRGNSATGQYLEPGHQEEWVCSGDQISFMRLFHSFIMMSVHGLDKSRVKSCPMQLGSCSQSLM